MKADILILRLQTMIDKYGNQEVEAYDDTVCPVKVKRVTYGNASDWDQTDEETAFRIRCK